MAGKIPGARKLDSGVIEIPGKAVKGLGYMKLKVYAEKMGVCYQTAWRWYKDGKILGAFKQGGETILVPVLPEPEATHVVLSEGLITTVDNLMGWLEKWVEAKYRGDLAKEKMKEIYEIVGIGEGV